MSNKPISEDLRLRVLKMYRGGKTAAEAAEHFGVCDLRAVVNDEQRYFIIKVTPAKQAAFLWAVEKDAGLKLEDYADILYRGWDEPEADLKEQLRQEYGLPTPPACTNAT